MDYIYTTVALSTLTVGVICYNHYAPKIDYQFIRAAAMDLLNRWKKKLLGISSFHKDRNNYFVKTDLGPVAVNYHKTPALDTDVYFFNKGHLMEINHSKMIKKKDFNQKYEGENTTMLRKYNFGVIGDIYYPRDFKNKDKLVGFIFNFLEDYVYIFVVDKNQIIDYKNIFAQYEEALNDPLNDGDDNELVRIDSCNNINALD